MRVPLATIKIRFSLPLLRFDPTPKQSRGQWIYWITICPVLVQIKTKILYINTTIHPALNDPIFRENEKVPFMTGQKSERAILFSKAVLN